MLAKINIQCLRRLCKLFDLIFNKSSYVIEMEGMCTVKLH